MRRDLLELAADLARRGEPFALATVVGRKAPVSTHVGDVALVTRDGRFHGWVGGSCTRPTVLAEAQQALADGKPRRVVLDPEPVPRDDGAHVFPMTCHSGGSVEIHIQPVPPAPQLVVYGISPIARALARLAKRWATRCARSIPWRTRPRSRRRIASRPRPAVRIERGAAPLLTVVATQGQWDEDAILAAFSLEPDYVAVVASPKRFAEMRSLLEPRAPASAWARIHNPAGLDLGAQTPEEIALSILAEIVKERPRAQAVAEAPAAVEAIDPVCGMSVAVKGARHRATHEGGEYYFCNAGCRERFVANPRDTCRPESRRPGVAGPRATPRDRPAGETTWLITSSSFHRRAARRPGRGPRRSSTARGSRRTRGPRRWRTSSSGAARQHREGPERVVPRVPSWPFQVGREIQNHPRRSLARRHAGRPSSRTRAAATAARASRQLGRWRMFAKKSGPENPRTEWLIT